MSWQETGDPLKWGTGKNLMKGLFPKYWEGLLKLTGDGLVPGLVTFRSLKFDRGRNN